MRKNAYKKLKQHRFEKPGHPLHSDYSWGNNGVFYLKYQNNMLTVIVSDGLQWEATGMPLPAWEHVSVSLPHRTPTWQEMCFVKDLFWTKDECVIQFHPPEEEYVNFHPHCLHLWKPIKVDGTPFEIPLPPMAAVGVK